MAHVLQMMPNRLNFLAGKKQQRPVAQRTQIDLVKQAVEQSGRRFTRAANASSAFSMCG